jgi:hypothetical protein
MIRNYKTFGLALVAMLALCAFVAQGVSANPLTVEGIEAGKTVYLTGDQDEGKHKFSSSATVECTTAHFLAQATASELTVTPSYPTEKTGGGNNCVAFGFADTHIKMNGCQYTFTTPTKIGSGEVTWHPKDVHITCPEGKKVEITPTTFGVSSCTQFIAAQTPTTVEKSHAVGRNAGTVTAMDITLEVTLTGIHWTGSGGACGTGGTNASYTGNSTIKCYSDEARTKQVGCTFS